jgi:hypothetical protein
VVERLYIGIFLAVTKRIGISFSQTLEFAAYLATDLVRSLGAALQDIGYSVDLVESTEPYVGKCIFLDICSLEDKHLRTLQTRGSGFIALETRPLELVCSTKPASFRTLYLDTLRTADLIWTPFPKNISWLEGEGIQAIPMSIGHHESLETKLPLAEPIWDVLVLGWKSTLLSEVIDTLQANRFRVRLPTRQPFIFRDDAMRHSTCSLVLPDSHNAMDFIAPSAICAGIYNYSPVVVLGESLPFGAAPLCDLLSFDRDWPSRFYQIVQNQDILSIGEERLLSFRSTPLSKLVSVALGERGPV